MTHVGSAEVVAWRAGVTRALAPPSPAALLGAAVGLLSLHGARSDATPPDPATFAEILGRNVPVALLAYSGVVTAGLSTLLASVVVGGFVGATFAAAAGNVGWAAAAGSIAAYAPLEMLALLVAAAAGLLPVASAFARRPGTSRRTAYRDALVPSAVVLAGALVLLVVAAAIEALVIEGRT